MAKRGRVKFYRIGFVIVLVFVAVAVNLLTSSCRNKGGEARKRSNTSVPSTVA
jgi:hypothetical protein